MSTSPFTLIFFLQHQFDFDSSLEKHLPEAVKQFEISMAKVFTSECFHNIILLNTFLKPRAHEVNSSIFLFFIIIIILYIIYY
jgi:hypothetical protein